MKTVAAFCVGAMALPLLHAADWIKVTSANFELFTNSGEHEARQTLEVFEQVRDFFMRVKSSSVTTRLPVTIVGFRNPKEYKPYTVSEAAAAYYNGDEQHDYIVMSDLASERTPMAIHEYMHLLVRHSGLKMPLWLNEGFADVYSTLQPRGGQIVLGEVPQGRAYALNQQKWMPLSTLFQVTTGSADYNEKDRAGIFYAESWLLAHMLMLSPEYKDQFSNLVGQLSGSASTEAALSAVYGKSLAQVTKDMNAYFRQSNLRGVGFKEGFRKIEIAPSQPAGDLEIGLTLARLVALLGRQDEASHRLRELGAAHEDSYEVEEALAYIEWRKGNREAAVDHFKLAIARGDGNWKTNWDYARLLGGGSDSAPESVQALRRALASKPDLVEARLMLGGELYVMHSYAQALVELRQVKKVDAEHAHALFLTMAYAAMDLKLEDDAKGYAEQAKKYARNPNEISSADKLLQYFEQKNAPVVRPARPAVAAASDDPPVLQRREVENPRVAEVPRTSVLKVTGRLTQLDCLDGAARMHITAGTTTYTLLIRQPDKIVINRGAAAVDMTCGPQSKPVSVDYLEVRDEKYGTTGDVRAIELP